MSIEKKQKKDKVQISFYCTSEEQQWLELYRFRHHIPTKTDALCHVMRVGMEQINLLEQQASSKEE